MCHAELMETDHADQKSTQEPTTPLNWRRPCTNRKNTQRDHESASTCLCNHNVLMLPGHIPQPQTTISDGAVKGLQLGFEVTSKQLLRGGLVLHPGHIVSGFNVQFP